MKADKIQPRILAGFQELLPAEQIAMNKIRDVIRQTYESFGFIPLDTPVLELSEVLLAKAGGETEKQIYRFSKGDTDMSLRFDLTVPLARYVAQHYAELTFPFKRYHIGKVYRGERPQKGRFREFYQCDIDVIGNESLSLTYDAEIPAIIYTLFKKLGIDGFKISINNRKILKGFFAAIDATDKITEILRLVDKQAKIGADKVFQELSELGLSKDKVEKIIKFISINQDEINTLKSLNIDNELFQEGIAELSFVLDNIKFLGVPPEYCKIDLSIARGLDYYTGTIYETTFTAYPEIGSVCSGGRYDDLAGFYTDKKLPGVGISIGLTRLFDQMQTRGFIPVAEASPSFVMAMGISEEQTPAVLSFATKLRDVGINTEVYMEQTKKFKVKMSYADKIKVPFVVIIGEDEVKQETIVIKNMTTGEQNTFSISAAIDFLAQEQVKQRNNSSFIKM